MHMQMTHYICMNEMKITKHFNVLTLNEDYKTLQCFNFK